MKFDLKTAQRLTKDEMKNISAGNYIKITCASGTTASSTGSTMAYAQSYAKSLCGGGKYTIIEVGLQAPYEPLPDEPAPYEPLRP
ncbi:hypothetical protein [Flavobacterium johnsoniae]|uniref:Uncharacterized protein n=1 Tax=Flavobacterium johnsoniae TaxID=986 RepID=A0A1M5S831_FLAJO|nr:hypothetical protein [Flavobacterium johnsoniae]SHH34629.1 hypothetical protein SAMN05444388_109156 [Flavobacterium johnsoniae]